jgi:hypothetical protein
LLHVGYGKTVEFKNRLDFLIARNALIVVWISEAFTFDHPFSQMGFIRRPD